MLPVGAGGVGEGDGMGGDGMGWDWEMRFSLLDPMRLELNDIEVAFTSQMPHAYLSCLSQVETLNLDNVPSKELLK